MKLLLIVSVSLMNLTLGVVTAKIGADPCALMLCRDGLCKVDKATWKPFCEPSCSVNNGGCAEDEKCQLVTGKCKTAPCPSTVYCVSKPVNPCAATTCGLVGSICKVDKASGKAFCEPSCKINNGGCKVDEKCTLKTVQCITTPCPPQIECLPKVINLCDTMTCPVGSICKVDRGSGEAFCEPSCKINNGGCKTDEKCTLKTVQCITTPCPRQIECVSKVNPCATITCPVGSTCKVDRGSGETFCKPSCKINNGGCKIDEKCTLKSVQCIRAPCPPQIECVPKVSDPSCSLNNGGCADDQKCTLMHVQCFTTPCPPVIKCVALE